MITIDHLQTPISPAFQFEHCLDPQSPTYIPGLGYAHYDSSGKAILSFDTSANIDEPLTSTSWSLVIVDLNNAQTERRG